MNNNLSNDQGTKTINTYVGYVLEKWLCSGLKLDFENLVNAYKLSVIYDPNIHFSLKDKIQDKEEKIRAEELDALEDFLLNEDVPEDVFNEKVKSI